ncbi:hypothetical protein T492DRAFT_959936 [Pavlovales sp. CCMP2436]|nr:hypothetical protein T492DRAFT_959936 [Pavlovales sp. CCMP2436]
MCACMRVCLNMCIYILCVCVCVCVCACVCMRICISLSAFKRLLSSNEDETVLAQLDKCNYRLHFYIYNISSMFVSMCLCVHYILYV